MARRYSGGLNINVRLRLAGNYGCTVSDSSSTVSVKVNPPACPEHAIDSSEAYDDAARAAVAFALEEKDDHGVQILDESQVAFTDSGIHIARQRRSAWGS